MAMHARIFPVTSKEALVAFGKAIDEWSDESKAPFFAPFGRSGRERWFYQEIDRRPHVIAITEADSPLDPGFEAYGKAKDPFTQWFREAARELTGFDLLEAPKGPSSEFIYELRAR